MGSSIDREKVIKGLECCSDMFYGAKGACSSCGYSQRDRCFGELVYDSIALLKEQTEIVRCKDCKHRGDSKKCVLSAISEEKDFPLFMLDNRGEWFCADGERRNE